MRVSLTLFDSDRFKLAFISYHLDHCKALFTPPNHWAVPQLQPVRMKKKKPGFSYISDSNMVYKEFWYFTWATALTGQSVIFWSFGNQLLQIIHSRWIGEWINLIVCLTLNVTSLSWRAAGADSKRPLIAIPELSPQPLSSTGRNNAIPSDGSSTLSRLLAHSVPPA